MSTKSAKKDDDAPDDPPEGVTYLEGKDPTEAPEDNPGLVVVQSPHASVPGERDPDYDPDSVGLKPAFPEPFVAPPPGVTKDSSADYHDEDAVPTVGWVDHMAIDPRGKLNARHSLGGVTIPNYVPVSRDDTAASPTATESKTVKTKDAAKSKK